MRHLVVPTTVLTLASLIRPAVAGETCAPALVLVVLDKSSSMQTGSIGGVTKWDIAVEGLGDVLSAYEASAEFGLMTFPRAGECSPGQLDVMPAMNNRGGILAALSTPPPTAGNWTPMAQTLEVALTEPALVNTTGSRHVIVITDGWQWCSPYDPGTRFDGVEAVSKLAAAGVTTWVVGFGAEVDAAALNQMAMVANTAKPNCDASNTDPAAPNNCYFQVDNATQLVTALDTIAATISADELCDGVDNDCDGQIDEDLVRDCSTACGSGTQTCNNGTWSTCTVAAPSTEVCDGEDNDCNGEIDDNCDIDPPVGEGPGSYHAGCQCNTGGPIDATAFAPFATLAVLLLRRRRRR